jgi:hypothetical protein
MAGGSEGEAFFVVLERERDGCFLPHKKRVQGRTEAAMERERKGGAQALGAWGEKHRRRTSSHSLFFSIPNKQTNPKEFRPPDSCKKQKKKIRCSLLLQYTHPYMTMGTYFSNAIK